MIDDKVFIGLGTTLIVSLVGWAFKHTNDRIARNEQANRKLEEKMAREFHTKEVAQLQHQHINEMMKEIREELKNINQKLDKKVDK